MSTAVGEGARDGIAPAWSLRRVVSAAVIGNVLEWYDFAVYGFFAPILATQFFPSGDPVVSLLAAFAAFAIGFLMRPVGAALFGYVGDRYGRVRALVLSIAMMAIPTVAMGLLPTYATLGVVASFLIVLLRMFQGMAVGGEFTASIVFLAENSPAKRRGFFASFAMFGATFGTMLGSAVGGLLTRVLTAEQLASWGWRAAFVLGLSVAIVGVVLMRNMRDSPARTPSLSPLVLAFRDHRLEVLRVFALNVGTATTYYILFVYAATWVGEKTPLGRAAALDVTTSSILTFLVVLPVAAWISDRVGRRLVMLCGMTGCLLLAYPLVSAM
ncbi:MAG TPA: MFS transporter, partial [Gammaproteobacteria bacterium]|nr:MFS transporter [Gammaproteobacteria bacterium]